MVRLKTWQRLKKNRPAVLIKIITYISLCKYAYQILIALLLLLFVLSVSMRGTIALNKSYLHALVKKLQEVTV